MIRYGIQERTDVSHARQGLTRVAEAAGLAERDVSRLALVATELASNLVKHAGGGEIVAGALHPDLGPRAGLRLWALDTGPGMGNPANCLRDGYSTAGSPGTGLGAVVRLADGFDLHSQRDIGTAMVVDLANGERTAPPLPADVGAIVLPKVPETECGDAWAVRADGGNGLLLMVADGLGHGSFAAIAGGEAAQAFSRSHEEAPAALLRTLHEALRPTRGAAVAVASLALTDGRQVRYGGIGNIAGVILTHDGRRSMVSMEGIVGHNARKVQEFSYPLPDGAVLVMHSDGLVSSWSVQPYRGLLSHSAALIAGVLYRDHTRGRDDVCVVVVKDGESGEARP